ncbi:MAG: acyl-CoA dehydratase activase [Lachnospiraceae bacterium]|nr:acyl-CoA dehydratase activase [Lachnospiraceae bacterium]
MWYIGIDMGSTCTKIAVVDGEQNLVFTDVRPTGWSSVETSEMIHADLIKAGYLAADEEVSAPAKSAFVTATGYGRVSVPFANKSVTEITCHGRGADFLFGSKDLCIIDIGGQDTKAIKLENGLVKNFMMNDKCSAGTGRFLEIMGNNMALKPNELCEIARSGRGIKISSMCTVFAESEVISLIGRGEKRENIAYAVVDSIAEKVVSQCSRIYVPGDMVCLTGGLCACTFLREMLEKKIGAPITTNEKARFAGAVGAALISLKSAK